MRFCNQFSVMSEQISLKTIICNQSLIGNPKHMRIDKPIRLQTCILGLKFGSKGIHHETPIYNGHFQKKVGLLTQGSQFYGPRKI